MYMFFYFFKLFPIRCIELKHWGSEWRSYPPSPTPCPVRLEETFDLSTTVKFAYIHWTGKDIPFAKRGKYGVVHGSIEKYFDVSPNVHIHVYRNCTTRVSHQCSDGVCYRIRYHRPPWGKVMTPFLRKDKLWSRVTCYTGFGRVCSIHCRTVSQWSECPKTGKSTNYGECNTRHYTWVHDFLFF